MFVLFYMKIAIAYSESMNLYKNKKVEPLSYLFSLKLTNLTKPKLMKKNVLQIYVGHF